jgi:4-aminobutyrate aminotransferase-like enzyme
MTPEEILELRRRHVAPSLSISYGQPLAMVRGEGQYLVDANGQRYLDCVNNVCHVGHCHPDVVRAGQQQMAALNTNTRYLHEHLVEYARRLTALFPDPLSVCIFTCTGSEANDLALRMARNHTGRRDVIVVDGAYHGTTTATIEVSPYKFAGPGGSGPAEHIHVVPVPDPYRGAYKRDDPNAGPKYAAAVERTIETAARADHAIAAFICESIQGVGGQIVMPDGYLAAAYEHVRRAGGLCIADEVQVGFGRVGSHFWAFETQGVVPDIVTLGKPMGNGHPLAGVVTTPEIAASFDNGMEYFNTYGGNPVSCAIGLAVLDVIEREHLQDNARDVGAHLLAGLRDLMTRHELIGDVRGVGLFIGVELVRDRTTLEPADAEAHAIVERMKNRHILLSVDGPLHNVLKIKPPIVFTRDDADQLVLNLDDVISCLN